MQPQRAVLLLVAACLFQLAICSFEVELAGVKVGSEWDVLHKQPRGSLLLAGPTSAEALTFLIIAGRPSNNQQGQVRMASRP